MEEKVEEVNSMFKPSPSNCLDVSGVEGSNPGSSPNIDNITGQSLALQEEKLDQSQPPNSEAGDGDNAVQNHFSNNPDERLLVEPIDAQNSEGLSTPGNDGTNQDTVISTTSDNPSSQDSSKSNRNHNQSQDMGNGTKRIKAAESNSHGTIETAERISSSETPENVTARTAVTSVVTSDGELTSMTPTVLTSSQDPSAPEASNSSPVPEHAQSASEDAQTTSEEVHTSSEHAQSASDDVQTTSSEANSSEHAQTTSAEANSSEHAQTTSSEEVHTSSEGGQTSSVSEEVHTSSEGARTNSLQEIPVVSQALRETDDEGRVESQTSFVNEYALNASTESPTYEVDRNLEQFSEILLDSDPSDEEAVKEGLAQTAQAKKPTKRVRFADEVSMLEAGSQQAHSSPPPPLPGLPAHPSPNPSSKHPGVPITPSPTSPKQKVPFPGYTVDELINGVELPAEYLGSTPIILDGIGAMKTARMFQAQQAVQLIKDPESESQSRPRFSVKLKVSTGAVRIADSKTDVDLMDHPLHTITYVADIDHVLVIMAHVSPPLVPHAPPRATNGGGETPTEGEAKYIPKMTCHVLDSSDARVAAMVIGQAFSAAYKQFLRSSGISDQHLEQAEYAHILNAQSVPRIEVESLGDRNKIKKLTLPKHKNDIMGMMVMESGYGSAIPACVIVHLSKTGSAFKCGLLNIGDHILSINGVNLVGMPRKTCLEHVKKCRYMNVVKMEVCSCSTVVDVTIVRPDLKFQLGFTVHEGMICSLVRGSIAERSGVRIGHRIIDINGTSTVGMKHLEVVHLLSSTVGDLHIRMMPDILYRLLTGKLQPECY